MVARPNPDRMASYSASLFEAGKSRRMDCSSHSPFGALRRSPTPDPDEWEAPSTCRDHQSSKVDSLSGWNRRIFCQTGLKVANILSR